MAEHRQIDWASAEIEDGTLTVDLAGDSSKDWLGQFKVVLALLARSGSSWGEISAGKHAITVRKVEPGSESELRHLLESVVQQVNADLGPAQEQAQDGSITDGAEFTEEDAARARDREMTSTFRGFAEQSRQ